MKKVLFLALCAVTVAVSCEKVIGSQQEEVNNQEQQMLLPEANPKTSTYSLVFDPEISTKLSIDGEGKTKWEINDKILIHGQYINQSGYSVVVELDGVTNTISADGKTAYITITTTEADEPLVDGCVRKYTRADYKSSIYAAYPAEAVVDGSVQSYYYNVFKNTNAPICIGYDDGAGSFVFRNYCAVISFIMPDTEDFDTYVFSGNASEVVGYSNYVARHALGTTELKKDQGVNSSGLYTTGPLTSISGPVVCDGATVNRICIPTPTSAGEKVTFAEGFTIKFLKDGVVCKKVSTSAKDLAISRNDYMPLGNISGALKPYVDDYTPASWTSGAIDLSSSKTKVANSYMVLTTDAGSAFKIPAVKGNNASETLVPSGVSLLWETWNGSATVTANSVIKAVDYDSEWIYFQLPDAEDIHAGNALIASKNALGEYIWSWHIWVPETDLIATPITAGGKSWMPCNLGALATAAGNNGLNYGLQYQWGRPTPSVGLDGTGGTSYAKTAPAGAITTQSVSDESKTITDIIKTPTVFYVNNHCWYDPTTAELWSSTKTIYDPCPAGWRVPEHGLIDPASAVHDDVNGGVTISGMYFPGTGSRSRYVGTWPEGNCYVWSCDTYVGSNKQRAYWYMFYDADASGFDVKEYKTTSAPVRCIKE